MFYRFGLLSLYVMYVLLDSSDSKFQLTRRCFFEIIPIFSVPSITAAFVNQGYEG